MSRRHRPAARLLAPTLATGAVLIAAACLAPPTAAQEIQVTSQCRPEGGDSFPVGDSIVFLHRPEGEETPPGPPVLPKLPLEAVPPCLDLDLTATGVTGRPPLDLQWLAPDGTTASGDTLQIDTTDLDNGVHTYTFTVSNDAGDATRAVNVWVARLEPFAAPVADQAPSPDLQVGFSAEAAGAHEWSWNFGDGTTTPWQVSCDPSRSTVSHTYNQAGVYAVVAYARNCRDGTVASEPLLISVGGAS